MNRGANITMTLSRRLSIALLIALILLVSARSTADSKSVVCAKVVGTYGLTIGPRPVGDFAGQVEVAGKRFTSWVTDVLVIKSKSTGSLVGWLYLDQFGLRWLQLRDTPRGLTSTDIAGAKLVDDETYLSAVTGTLNPNLLELSRCDSFR